ncbi:MAG TPA: hypothetical protein VGR16_12325, partial [Thermomicrobiales bacterium]|nr:hypothetical protein [Thermomicrobiales bacterium]
RYFALFTDDDIAGSILGEFGESGLPPEEFNAFISATPQALPAENRAAILAVVDVRVLADGRVAGVFDVYDPFAEPPGPARFYWEFVELGGRWLIDEEVMLGPIEPAQVGTPVS